MIRHLTNISPSPAGRTTPSARALEANSHTVHLASPRFVGGGCNRSGGATFPFPTVAPVIPQANPLTSGKGRSWNA